MEVQCLNCGKKCDFIVSNEGDPNRGTIGVCSNCGKKQVMKEKNPLVRKSQISVIDNTASDKPEPKNDPKKPQYFNPFAKKRRKYPLEHIKDDPMMGENTRGVRAKTNPLVKKSSKEIAFEMGFADGKASKRMPKINENDIIQEHIDDYLEGFRIGRLEQGESTMAKKNPFVKEAREFLMTEEQKNRDKKTNMVFPEGGLEGKGDGKSLPHTKFDTVDRKEHRHSPDPSDFIPGYKEWFDSQVDKYYDGWVEDHIRNSGGEIVGSNTPGTMNLEKGEREHAPTFPTEAPYEKQLESRHHFNNYETIIAKNTKWNVKKSDLKELLKKAQISPEAKEMSPEEIEGQVISTIEKQPKVAEGIVYEYLVEKQKEEPIRESLQNLALEARDIILNNIGKAVNIIVQRYLERQQMQKTVNPPLKGVQDFGGQNVINLDEPTAGTKKEIKIAQWDKVPQIVKFLISHPEIGVAVYKTLKNNFGKKEEPEVEACMAKRNPFITKKSNLKKESYQISDEEIKKIMQYPEIVEDIIKKYFALTRNKPIEDVAPEPFKPEDTGVMYQAKANPFLIKAKKKNVKVPYCPNPEHKEKKYRLVNGGDENRLLVCPKCGNVYHPEGQAFREPSPDFYCNSELPPP